ncbi:hypothetical protein AALO_G00196500 [Alosa alosa]|uniref:Transposase n=1 Tax=Alosa alosa TaxID=278164 RepID=A0AAV6G1W0_9TELE|nr:hypothetical protein AALO_G00196500 [Alosa alosa]
MSPESTPLRNMLQGQTCCPPTPNFLSSSQNFVWPIFRHWPLSCCKVLEYLSYIFGSEHLCIDGTEYYAEAWKKLHGQPKHRLSAVGSTTKQKDIVDHWLATPHDSHRVF